MQNPSRNSCRSHPSLCRLFGRLLLIAAILGAIGPVGGGSIAHADTYTVVLDEEARSEPATGRVVLFFITSDHRRFTRRMPIMGPFWDPPQPMASVAVNDLKPGASVVIDGDAIAFPESIDSMKGTIRVQAFLDADTTERAFIAGPGNVASEVVALEVDPEREDSATLHLTNRVAVPRPREDELTLRWIDLRSDLLSEFYGHDVYHRAGVALPQGYIDPDSKRERWPTVYVIPGYGGRHEGARDYQSMMATLRIEEIAPIAVYVVLDPECPLGHHGFADSANNGPRSKALVTELIPYLENKFRLVAEREARIVTGHSSGGWSSLWLQLNHPDIFGACWSSAPDPVDFTAFQMNNLYEDKNLYFGPEGESRPSYRQLVSAAGDMEVSMTVEQECRMEYVLSPEGASGEQWDAWESMFSPRDEKSKLPQPMFNPMTGDIDHAVVEHWNNYDIARLVSGDWKRFGPIMAERVRLNCGGLDSFYLNRAVEQLAKKVAALREESGTALAPSPGYITIVPDETHNTLTSKIYQRVNREMRSYLQERGLQDP